MRILIIGAVAGGTSAAAKARRNDEACDIVIYEKDMDISYSGCGLPYYIGDDSISRETMVPRDAKYFKSKYNVDVLTSHEVRKIYADRKEIEVCNLATNKVFTDSYDKLVISTGATAVMPPIEGLSADNSFVLRNVKSADKIKDYIIENEPRRAAIIGTGFIGLEMVESLVKRGIKVTLIEKENRVMPSLDEDMSFYLEDYLKKKGVKIFLGKQIERVRGSLDDVEIVLDNGVVIEADFIVVAAGIRPQIELARAAGIKIGETGAIWVDKQMQTSIKDVFACGDCAESYFLINSKPIYRPLGSTANKMGRLVGDAIFGKDVAFRGILGTGIFKVFDMTVAQTGMSEEASRKEGLDVIVCHNIKPDRPEYMGGKNLFIKAVALKESGLIIGVQIIGESGVDKRIDVFVTAMTFGAKAQDLFHLDLAYAPPFSTTKDPVMYTGMILENALFNDRELISPTELEQEIKLNPSVQIIDARSATQYEENHVENATNMPQEAVRKAKETIDPQSPVVVYCNKGTTGNAVQNILINSGFKKVYNLSGGHQLYKKIKDMRKQRSDEESEDERKL
jgi:NADPH-dependent 2,4-dienoyl-CoA reductase/sulfur reductase-like enzyme/rhodanese-related sulfurtransferase